MRDIPCDLTINELTNSQFEIGSFSIRTEMVIHRGPTMGYRIDCDSKSLAYIPDHEPMISTSTLYKGDKWVSGFYLAQDADVLIHDTQYTEEEYSIRNGFGHSSIQHSINFAKRSHCKRLFMFHHDPEHNDKFLEGMLATARDLAQEDLVVELARQGSVHDV